MTGLYAGAGMLGRAAQWVPVPARSGHELQSRSPR